MIFYRLLRPVATGCAALIVPWTWRHGACLSRLGGTGGSNVSEPNARAAALRAAAATFAAGAATRAATAHGASSGGLNRSGNWWPETGVDAV